MAHMENGGPRWSEDVHQADWIAERLRPWSIRPYGDDDALTVATVVPEGFESYARLLHPAVAHHQPGDRLVRWAEVAAWSGMPLYRRAQFHSVALPPSRRPVPPPFSEGPHVGTLDLADAAVLADVLRAWTSTPDDCWFCVWNGFGWDSAGSAAARLVATTGEPPGVRPALPADPVPPAVRSGPLVHLPHRDYLLYRGPAAAVTALAEKEQTANLWWPADRAWCVATEIDLQSTYVGGPAVLIDAMLSDDRIETLSVPPDDPVSLVLEDWVAAWVDDLTNTLLAEGEAALTTSRGTVQARLHRPSRGDSAGLCIEVNGDDGSWSASDGRPRSSDPRELRRQITFQLTHAILSLAPE
jgi:hypothetical protein